MVEILQPTPGSVGFLLLHPYQLTHLFPKGEAMDLPKAIKILKEERERIFNYYNPDRKGALDLGIEALELLTTEPCQGCSSISRPLRGETD